ncbi:MAG: ROK family protein [Anaerolineales bacterium]|nr:ROK family protein [Anaerolineales bacterium]
MEILGIDIGGSGIKGALVNTESGEITTERFRIDTPRPATPKAVIKTIKNIANHFDYMGPIGVGFPGIVVDGVILSAVNIHAGWVNYNGAKAISDATGCPVTIKNDADVAGLAEMAFGAGRGMQGIVMIFTLGTGIGSVMFNYGCNVPNLELGHLYMPGHKQDAEFYAADRARKAENLSWKEWGKRLNEYFQYIEFLFSPQVIILGGGVSKKHDKFLKYIRTRAQVLPAQLRNHAGIVGAAMSAIG